MYRELFELEAADIIQLHITHFGGFLQAKKWAAWPDAYFVLVAPRNVSEPVLYRGQSAPGRVHDELQDSGALQ